jgi:hypothetical protein
MQRASSAMNSANRDFDLGLRQRRSECFDLIEQPMNRCAEQSFSAAAIAMLPYLLLAVR